MRLNTKPKVKYASSDASCCCWPHLIVQALTMATTAAAATTRPIPRHRDRAKRCVVRCQLQHSLLPDSRCRRCSYQQRQLSPWATSSSLETESVSVSESSIHSFVHASAPGLLVPGGFVLEVPSHDARQRRCRWWRRRQRRSDVYWYWCNFVVVVVVVAGIACGSLAAAVCLLGWFVAAAAAARRCCRRRRHHRHRHFVCSAATLAWAEQQLLPMVCCGYGWESPIPIPSRIAIVVVVVAATTYPYRAMSM